MYYLVKDIAAWRTKLAVKKPKIAGFVSGQLTGKEREAFDELFGKFASKFRKKILFLYVDLDRDQLWDVYDEVNPSMRLIPLVAVFDAEGNLLKKRINPTEKEFDSLIKLALAMPIEMEKEMKVVESVEAEREAEKEKPSTAEEAKPEPKKEEVEPSTETEVEEKVDVETEAVEEKSVMKVEGGSKVIEESVEAEKSLEKKEIKIDEEA